mmetsp:Transcript_2271/g.8907  ORF Transcript_2271/g.8907 Transcript_2271/m.8907 type:complete len:340 (-) Transcript_2271:1311-2330(-)
MMAFSSRGRPKPRSSPLQAHSSHVIRQVSHSMSFASSFNFSSNSFSVFFLAKNSAHVVSSFPTRPPMCCSSRSARVAADSAYFLSSFHTEVNRDSKRLSSSISVSSEMMLTFPDRMPSIASCNCSSRPPMSLTVFARAPMPATAGFLPTGVVAVLAPFAGLFAPPPGLAAPAGPAEPPALPGPTCAPCAPAEETSRAGAASRLPSSTSSPSISRCARRTASTSAPRLSKRASKRASLEPAVGPRSGPLVPPSELSSQSPTSNSRANSRAPAATCPTAAMASLAAPPVSPGAAARVAGRCPAPAAVCAGPSRDANRLSTWVAHLGFTPGKPPGMAEETPC